MTRSGVYELARAIRNYIHLRTYKRRIVQHTFHGRHLRMMISDRIASEWYDKDWGRQPEIDFLRSHVPSNGLVFDLGAHQGLVAMLLSQDLVPSGKVIAVEGSRHNYEVAVENFSLNAISNIEVVHGMIAKDDGEGFMTSTLNSSAIAVRSGFGVKVASLSVDTMTKNFGNPDLVFMDIEGYEAVALEGAPNTLKAAKCWFIEIHGDQSLSKFARSNQDVLNFFPPHDFNVFVIENDVISELNREQPAPIDRFFVLAVKKQH